MAVVVAPPAVASPGPEGGGNAFFEGGLPPSAAVWGGAGLTLDRRGGGPGAVDEPCVADARTDTGADADADGCGGGASASAAARDAGSRCARGRLRMPDLPFAAARLVAQGEPATARAVREVSRGSSKGMERGGYREAIYDIGEAASVKVGRAISGPESPETVVRLNLEDLERAARDFSRLEVGRRGQSGVVTDLVANPAVVQANLIDEELRLLESPRIDDGCSAAVRLCSTGTCRVGRGDQELDRDVVGGLSAFLARVDDDMLNYIISPTDPLVTL